MYPFRMIRVSVGETHAYQAQTAGLEDFQHHLGIVCRVDEHRLAAIMHDVAFHSVAADFSQHGFDARHQGQGLGNPLFKRDLFKRCETQTESGRNGSKLSAIAELIAPFEGRDVRSRQAGETRHIPDGQLQSRSSLLHNVTEIVFKRH
jgi:hypothetical protein